MRFNTPIVTQRGTTFYNHTKKTSPPSYFFTTAAGALSGTASSAQPSLLDATKGNKNITKTTNIKTFSSDEQFGSSTKKETKIDEQHEIVLNHYSPTRTDGLPVGTSNSSNNANSDPEKDGNTNTDSSAVVIIPNFDRTNKVIETPKDDQQGAVVGMKEVGNFIKVVEVSEHQGLMLVPSDLTSDDYDDDEDEDEDEDSFVEGKLRSDASTGDVLIGLLNVNDEKKKQPTTITNTDATEDVIIKGRKKEDCEKVNKINDGYFHPKMAKRTFLQEQQSKVHVPRRPPRMNVGFGASCGAGSHRAIGHVPRSKPSIRRSAVSVSERAKFVQSMDDEAKRRAKDPYNLSQFKKSWRRPHPSHGLPSTAWKRTIKGMGPPPPKKTLAELP